MPVRGFYRLHLAHTHLSPHGDRMNEPPRRLHLRKPVELPQFSPPPPLRGRTTRLDFCSSQKSILPREVGGAFLQRIQQLDTLPPRPSPSRGEGGKTERALPIYSFMQSPCAGSCSRADVQRLVLRHVQHRAFSERGDGQERVDAERARDHRTVDHMEPLVHGRRP